MSSGSTTPRPVGATPFPPLHLSDDDRETVRRAARSYIDEELGEYLRFMRGNAARRLPTETWRLLAEKNDLRVYTPRRPEDGVRVGSAADDVVSVLVTTGTVEGPLADCLLGAFSPSLEQELLKAAYAKDGVPNCAVLDVLETATPQDPFRSLKIMWYVKAMKGLFKLLIKDHDSVFIDGTGTVPLPNGEHAAFDLSHSVELPQVPTLKQYERVNMSIFTLWRPISHDRAEIYMRTFVDLRGAKGGIHSLPGIARSFFAIGNYAHVGKMKKLAWMLRCKALQGPPSVVDQTESAENNKCVSCRSGVSNVLHHRNKLCALCNNPVCSSCRITKKVYVVSARRHIRSYNVRLCPPCWLTASEADPTQVAIEDVLGRRASRSETGYSSSFMSLALDGVLSPGLSETPESLENQSQSQESSDEQPSSN